MSVPERALSNVEKRRHENRRHHGKQHQDPVRREFCQTMMHVESITRLHKQRDPSKRAREQNGISDPSDVLTGVRQRSLTLAVDAHPSHRNFCLRWNRLMGHYRDFQRINVKRLIHLQCIDDFRDI